MNTTRFFGLLFGIFATGLLQAADAPKATDRVQITFDHPEKFRDIKDHEQPTDRGQEAILNQIRTFMVKRAEQYLPGGYGLTVTFTDIDLAGDFEPWRGPNWDDVRMVKDIYPPSFRFAYSITDETGKVVKSGNEDITDLAFQMRTTIDSNDPLHYEKDILNDWLRQHLHNINKA